MNASPMLTPRSPTTYLLVVGMALALHGCAKPQAPRGTAPPVVGGLVATELSARVRGLVLLGELGCVACHQPGASAPRIEARPGPSLLTVGSRVHADYVAHFIADPLGTDPGTVMPDLLRDRAQPGAAAEALAHYLRSFAEPNAAASNASESIDNDAAVRGRELFKTIGCAACHTPPGEEGGDELELPGTVPLGPLAAKYPLRALRAFLLAPHDARPGTRMPDLNLSPAEANDLSNYLIGRTPTDAPPADSPAIDSVKVTAGRTLFAERGCAHCHALPDSERAASPRPGALSDLDPAQGCMSGDTGSWPFYALTAEQRADLLAAMTALNTPLDGEEHILQRLASRNCFACHQRGNPMGVQGKRAALFGTHDPSLGQEGRLPPSLLGVGAKLQPNWLSGVIAHGQSIRPYLHTRMPGFGEVFAPELTKLLVAADELPPIEVKPLPKDGKKARVITDLGRELVGDKGMNCISCHLFAGEKVGAMGAMDLVDSTGQRLRPEWFAHFMRMPFLFKPITLMPEFFPDGVSVRPEFGDGDTARQIDGMWHYLAKGRNTGSPRGMHRPSLELKVGDEAIVLRRSVQNTGKRGISVGYPGGVNLTFDAEHLGINQVWWGGFVDASPVWRGQGSGRARLMSRQRVELPNGPAFVTLSNAGAPWPEASRRELGQEFLGYDLDGKQRPSFRYVCDGVEITDTPREVIEGSDPAVTILRRTIALTSAADKTLYFRAAVNARIEDLGDGAVQVGKSLRLLLPKESFQIRAAGDARELLVEIPIRQGSAELVIDYRWLEGNK